MELITLLSCENGMRRDTGVTLAWQAHSRDRIGIVGGFQSCW